MSILYHNSWAQMYVWPLNTHGSATVSSDQEWFTDRARVTAMISGSTTKTLTPGNFNCSFTQGDWVMVIQMHQSSEISGNIKHTICEVTTPGTTISTVTITINGVSYTSKILMNGN